MSSSERTVRPGVKAALEPGETAVSGEGHAEQTILDSAAAHGQPVEAIGASRPIYPSCAESMEATGVKAASPLKNQSSLEDLSVSGE